MKAHSVAEYRASCALVALSIPGSVATAEGEPPPTSFLSPHSDLAVTAATVGVVVATVLLFMATRRLVKVTEKHVHHTQALVEAIRGLLVSQLTPSILFDLAGGAPPRLSIYNIGPVPVALEALEIEISGPKICQPCRVRPEDQRWLPIGEHRQISVAELSDLWASSTHVELVKVRCVYSPLSSRAILKDAEALSKPSEYVAQWKIDQSSRDISPAPRRHD